MEVLDRNLHYNMHNSLKVVNYFKNNKTERVPAITSFMFRHKFSQVDKNVKKLLYSNGDFYTDGDNKNENFEKGIRSNDYFLADFMLNNGANVNYIIDSMNNNSLDYLFKINRDHNIYREYLMKLLFKFNINTCIYDFIYIIPFITNKQYDIVKLFLLQTKYKLDVDYIIEIATESKNTELLKILDDMGFLRDDIIIIP